MAVLEQWNPITHDFGLIQAPLEHVLDSFLSWHASIGINYQRTYIATSLAVAFESLLPLANSKMRRLFVATRSTWVACFQNGIAGSDPFPAMSFLAGRMGVLAMRVCSTPERAMYRATVWEVYAPQSLGGGPLNYRRSIAALDDGGHWVFEESGERYTFERVERYAARRKRDRFTKNVLCEYLRHFGVELFADDFLRVHEATPAVRLQQLTKVWHSPEFTLEQVIAVFRGRESCEISGLPPLEAIPVDQFTSRPLLHFTRPPRCPTALSSVPRNADIARRLVLASRLPSRAAPA